MRATRNFGTLRKFTSEGGGRWSFSDWGRCWVIEKRRGEPGAPAGWWYIGPGAPDGARFDSPEGAAARAVDECHRYEGEDAELARLAKALLNVMPPAEHARRLDDLGGVIPDDDGWYFADPTERWLACLQAQRVRDILMADGETP